MPMIPVEEIAPDPDNVRVAKPDPKQDADLLASVKEQGVLMPILVRPHPDGSLLPHGGGEPIRYMVVAGHRRFAAAVDAEHKAIPAEIREFANEAEVRLAQLSENTRRADMQLVDVWAAVEAAAAAGLPDDGIALAMNRSRADVARFRAMGRLHDDLKEHIRANPNEVPDQRFLRVICQAPVHEQADAFHAKKGSLYGSMLWHAVAAMLEVKRIPLRHARFDRRLYTGPVFRELFAEPDDAEQAEDVEQFRRLQLEWMGDECGRRLKQGFGDAVVLGHDKYGSPERPTGAAKYGFFRQLPEKLPKKADRAGLIYSVCLEPSGEVTERLWEKAPEKEKREAPALGTPPKPVDPVLQAFTQKGAAELEKHKRRWLADALDDGSPLGRDLDVLVAVLGALLHEKVSGYTFGAGGCPPILPLLAEDGRLSIDGKMDELVAFARGLAAYALKASSTLSRAELIGDFLGAPVNYPADPDALSHIKGPGLKEIAKSMGYRDGTFSTQKKLREAIGKGLVQIGPQQLAVVGWRVPPKPTPFEARRIGGFDAAAFEAGVFGDDWDEYPEPVDLTLEQLHALLEAPEGALHTYTHDELREEKARRDAAGAAEAPAGVRSCRGCGCTDADCRGCVERTGEACHWVEKDLCSACQDNGALPAPGPTPALAATASVEYRDLPAPDPEPEDMDAHGGIERAVLGDADEIGPEHADLDLRDDVERVAAPNEAAFKAWEL